MLEFSRKHQEEQIVKGIKEDIRQLTSEEVDLEVNTFSQSRDARQVLIFYNIYATFLLGKNKECLICLNKYL